MTIIYLVLQVVNTGPSLFDSADEDDENDDKADGDRFHLKQHYEGKSGRKVRSAWHFPSLASIVSTYWSSV